MKKRILLISMLISCIMAGNAFAGTWFQDESGWYYETDYNKVCAVSTWQEIEGKSYYFGPDGYMLANTYTPDGYFVGADGAWNPEVEQISEEYYSIQSGEYTYENANEFWSFSISMYTDGDGYEVGNVEVLFIDEMSRQQGGSGRSILPDCRLVRYGINSYGITTTDGEMFFYIYAMNDGSLFASSGSNTVIFTLAEAYYGG